MLTECEEQALRQLVKDHTPMSVVRPGQSLAHPIPGITESVLRGLIRDSTPMAVTNPGAHVAMRDSLPATVSLQERAALEKLPKMQPVDMNDDAYAEAKLRDAGLEGKKLGEIYALGITRRQIVALPAAELAALVRAQEASAADTVPEPHVIHAVDTPNVPNYRPRVGS